jgi:multisubunit Na+/H+ antiporter MnhE subunit
MIILLTVVWIILRESLTVMTAVTGLAISVCCVLFSRRVIPLSKTESVKPLRFVIYLFYLLGQIYIGGVAAIKLILLDAHVEIVEINTQIKSSVLRTILVNSITLVPGSVSLDLTEDVITVLWLTKYPPDIENAGKLLKGKLERVLLKAQK